MYTGNAEPRVLQNGVVLLFGTVTFGSSGAVDSQTAENQSGFVVSKPSGTGLYRITLSKKAQGAHIMGLFPWAGSAANVAWQQQTDLTSNQTLDIQHLSAGSGANATSGHKLKICLAVNYSSAGVSL